MIIFLVIALFVVFCSHYLVYLTIVKFFLLGGAMKTGLAVGLALLSVSFILSLLLVHWKEIAATKAVYYTASVWMGILTNLVLLLIVFWVAYFALQLVGAQLPGKSVVIGIIFMSLLVSGWGIYNALHPRVQAYSLKLRGAPDAWRGKKIAHLSDLHLGLSNGVSFLDKVVKMTNDQKPDVIFITGDLFDGGDGNMDVFVPGLNQLQAPLGIYFVTGNHETYLGTVNVDGVLSQTKIQTLSDEAVQVQGVNIIGISYPGQGEEKDLAQVVGRLVSKEQYSNRSNYQPQFLLFHTPTSLDVFAQAGIDAMFSGHTHRGQLFPFGFLTSLIFHGYDRGLQEINGMQLYVSSGTGTWGPPMKTSGRTEVTVFQVE